VEDDDNDEYDDDDNFVEDEAWEHGRENVGPVASPYLKTYVYKRPFLDTQYGVRKEGDMIMIGYFPIVVDTNGYITIKDRVFKGSKSLWELLTRKKVNMKFIPKDDLKTYEKILTMTNVHLTKYQSDVNINITRRKLFGISLHISLRNRRDAGSNLRYDVSG